MAASAHAGAAGGGVSRLLPPPPPLPLAAPVLIQRATAAADTAADMAAAVPPPPPLPRRGSHSGADSSGRLAGSAPASDSRLSPGARACGVSAALDESHPASAATLAACGVPLPLLPPPPPPSRLAAGPAAAARLSGPAGRPGCAMLLGVHTAPPVVLQGDDKSPVVACTSGRQLPQLPASKAHGVMGWGVAAVNSRAAPTGGIRMGPAAARGVPDPRRPHAV